MENNKIELADFKDQANIYYKKLTEKAKQKDIGSQEHIYFTYGIEWAFNHLPQNNYDKLKKDNAALQKALSTLTGMHSNLKEDNALLLEALRWITQIDRNPDNYLKLVQIAKDEIQKVKK